MKKAEIVIIGGGVVGASVAYHLTETRRERRFDFGARIKTRKRFDGQSDGRRSGAV